MKRNCETLIVADFGCGEARLAQALSSSCKKIHSFDLVALNDKITVCDFSRTPLANESVDIAVFCLSRFLPGNEHSAQSQLAVPAEIL